MEVDHRVGAREVKLKEEETFLPSSVFISKTRKPSKKELIRQRKILKLYEKYWELEDYDKLREIELKHMRPSFLPPVGIVKEIPKYKERFLQLGFSDKRHFELLKEFTGDVKKTTIFLENNLWILKAAIREYKKLQKEKEKKKRKCRKKCRRN